MANIKISEKDFQRYVKVQRSGKTNMFNLNNVQVLSGLTKDKIKAVMEQYDSLCDLYPKVVA